MRQWLSSDSLSCILGWCESRHKTHDRLCQAVRSGRSCGNGAKKFTSARVSSPGEILSEELEERGWTQKDLAKIMDRSEQAIAEIINGKKQIDSATAIKLSEVFDTSAQFWMNLEANCGQK
jgi:addiction module HigA family antidote